MSIDMPEKEKEWLEAEALKAARQQEGCHDLEAVRIRPTHTNRSGTHWEVAELIPPLPQLAESYARKAIDRLRGTYSLKRS